MSLKHVVLGFLVDKPVHGYQLKHALSPGLTRKQMMNDGVLYPLLARMEKEGLLHKKVQSIEGAPDRHVLYPTAKGRETFREWLESSTSEEDAMAYDFFLGHPFLLKCMFFKRLTRKEILGKFHAQRKTAEAKLKEFKRIRKGMIERRVDPFRIAILDLGMAQQRAKLLWLNRLLKKESRRKV